MATASSPVRIEAATRADIPALCELLALLFSQEAEFTPDTEAQARGLERVIASPDVGTVLVARDGPRVVGMVNLLYTVSTALGERVALLEDMVVVPDQRGGGVGARLLDEAITLARAGGCGRITLLTDLGNAAAQDFYKRHGFEPSAMTPMRLSLH